MTQKKVEWKKHVFYQYLIGSFVDGEKFSIKIDPLIFDILIREAAQKFTKKTIGEVKIVFKLEKD
jgi:hypothetical protein